MMHKFSWVQDKKVLLVSVLGDVTADEIIQINEGIAQSLVEGNPPVHCIVDLTQMGKYPLSIEVIKQKHPFGNPNAGWVVVVGANAIAKFLASTIMSLFQSQVLFEKTLDEACATIGSKDETVTV